MDLRLTDKRARVTGSTSGIGAEIARMLALEGVKIVVHGRDPDRAHGVVADIQAKGGQAAVAMGDLMTASGMEAVIRVAEQAFGGIEILVNNAGGSNSATSASWFETPVEEWAESYRQNTLPAVRVTQTFIP